MSKSGRNLKAITSAKLYLYGIRNFVSEWARRVGSVTDTKSMLEKIITRNRTDIESPRESPKSVIGNKGPISPISGIKYPKIVPF
jgi:hypothetical protein